MLTGGQSGATTATNVPAAGTNAPAKTNAPASPVGGLLELFNRPKK